MSEGSALHNLPTRFSLGLIECFDPLIRNAHLQTILARFWPVDINDHLFPTETRLFQTEPGVQVLAHCHYQDGRHATSGSPGTMLIVHGLTGSSSSHYVVRLAARALQAGFDVIRLNIRNCGGTEHLTPTLYHSGLTVDLRLVTEQLRDSSLFIAGFSIGANILLKLAGEWGRNAPSHVRAICAISAPIDLAVSARRLGERQNRFYEDRFLRDLRKTIQRKQALMPERYSLAPFSHIHSMIDFDDAYTAPCFGFRDAMDYYEQCSSKRLLPLIQVPTLILQAQDDPFIPFEMFDDPAFRENAFLYLSAPRHGGHVGFLSLKNPRIWDTEQTMKFCQFYSAGQTVQWISPRPIGGSLVS